jgi:CO/xanthine dehydrogenase Mo-binding subunit
MGQGINTVIAQIVAESFGITVDDVRIVFGDTGIVPFTTSTGSSSSTWYQGHAALRACQDAKQQIFTLAAPRLGVNPNNLEIKNWHIYERGTPGKSISLSHLFGGPGWWVTTLGEIIGRGEYTCSYIREDENGQSPRPVAYYSYVAHGMEVAVNVETGEVRIEKFASACDMGQPINPQMCEGQMAGGMVQGLSTALYEEVILDKGKVINPSLIDYRIPTTMDLPNVSNCYLMMASVPHSEGPFGAKGFAEGTIVPATAALGNAVYNAVGARIKDLPVTREKVWKALKEVRRSRH